MKSGLDAMPLFLLDDLLTEKSKEKVKKKSGLVYFCTRVYNMAFPVVEFSREGYKIRKVFG